MYQILLWINIINVVNAGKCSTGGIPNCAECEKNNLDICDECEDGYQINIDQTSCDKVTIANCIDYNEGECNACDNGRYREDCTEFVPDGSRIPNCKYYYAQDTVECYEYACDDVNKVVSISKTCVDKISNCITHEDGGVCQKCEPGYYWNGNENKCLGGIANCKSQGPGTEKPTTCSSCKDGYYLTYSSTECKEGTIDHCKVYNPQETDNADITCNECDNFYSLSTDNKKCYYSCYNPDSYCKECNTDSDGNFLDDCKTCENGKPQDSTGKCESPENNGYMKSIIILVIAIITIIS